MAPVHIRLTPLWSSLRENRKGSWYYTIARDRKDSEDVVHTAVPRFALLIGASHFHPERYTALLRVLLRAFDSEGGSPLALLQRVLSVSTKGSAEAPGGESFVASKFAAAWSDEALSSSLAATVKQVGAAGCATLWAAMMLRARVAVYAESAKPCLSLVRTLPLLAWHRKRWEVLIPLVGSLDAPEELEELSHAGTFAAGFTDARVLDRTDLFDVIVDARSGAVRLTPSGARLQPPASVASELEAALKRGGGLLGALEGLTARLLERGRQAPAGGAGGEESGEGAFLRLLLEAEGIGAGA